MKPFRFSTIPTLGTQSRWILIPSIGITVVLIEALEHILVGETLLSAHYLTEVVIYGILLPSLGVVLLRWLERAEMHRDRMASELGQLYQLGQQINQAESRDDLLQQIVAMPAAVIPTVISTRLYMVQEGSRSLQQAAVWGEGEASVPTPDYDTCTGTFCQGESCLLPSQRKFHLCQTQTAQQTDSNMAIYCMPLIVHNNLEGMLNVEIPSTAVVNDSQVNTLTRMGLDLALVIENARLLDQVDHQNTAAANERQRIAQDLHDTLGQNISYLRLKLEQLSSQNALVGIASIQNDLERMSAIAQEAYETVRSTLSSLHVDTTLALDVAIKLLVEKAAARMDLPVRFHSEGQRRTLRPQVIRQILYIFREVVNNVEKHSCARSVDVTLQWGREDVTLKITDDGIGFNPASVTADGKLGLTIMEERARAIDAQLSIDTTPDIGTSITLWFPVAQADA